MPFFSFKTALWSPSTLTTVKDRTAEQEARQDVFQDAPWAGDVIEFSSGAYQDTTLWDNDGFFDSDTIAGNDVFDDPAQWVLAGGNSRPAMLDYSFEVVGTNGRIYEIGVVDYDWNLNGQTDNPVPPLPADLGGESGVFFVFIGEAPPADMPLTVLSAVDENPPGNPLTPEERADPDGPFFDDTITNDTGELYDDLYVCFGAGTRIAVPGGETAVEDLVVGDRLLTSDGREVPVIWIGSRKLKTSHDLAPVQFHAGALNNRRDLFVSQQHRMLVTGWKAELLFGADEVLVAAKHLVNDNSIVIRRDLPEIEYFHLLCERHEILLAEGIPTESFHPGDGATQTLDQGAARELFRIFPELAHCGSTAYGSVARPCLRKHEARLV